ncbi:MAG: hypothetical protein JNJ65_09585 [Cyclobacteriaceae bacterium]|jgi:hypothetical protein|nr:hypothetical protein [Cyclobacteriaceae bacterium]
MKLLFTFLISLISVGLWAQNPAAKPTAASAAKSADCYDQWYALFKDRGANAVADGTHDVIISLQHDGYSECFLGKIDVASGKISSKLQIQKVDGSYDEFDKKLSSTYMSPEGTLKSELRDVVNGMTAALTLADGETIRLFFYKSLADKAKANKKAPAPSALIKN